MKKQLLIVDDEEDILIAMSAFYEQYDVDVTAVTDGRECIQKIEQGFKGIVLIDIMMPKMDGWQIIKELVDRELTDNLKIKIITGKGSKDHSKIQKYAPYIDDYLGKPFTHEMLLAMLN